MPRTKATKLADVTQVDAEDNSAEEYELVSFLDGLGPQGISEVTLYRIAQTGKQRFVTSGPPGQFTEQYIQQTYGGGDYLVRARLNGRWFRSKNFSIEGPPVDSNGHYNGAGHGAGGDIERLKVELDAQRLRLQEQQTQMEADRQAREQRNHELQLALIESTRQTAAPAVSVTDLITGLKSLKELSGGQEEMLGTMEKGLAIIERIANIRGGGGGEAGGGWLDWLKPVAVEAGKQLLPRVLPFITPTPQVVRNTPGDSVPPAGAAISATAPVPGPVPDAPETPIGDPPPGGPTAEEQYLFNKRQAIQFILPIARLGRDPEFYAEAAIEQIETTNNPVIARFVDEIVKAESFQVWFIELQTLDPTVITSQRWFELFFLAMRDAINAKSDEGEMK